MGRLQRNINLLFLVCFTAYTAYSIFYRHAGMFFIVYLFWFDELIRNISLLLQMRMLRKRAVEEDIPLIDKNKESVKARFFFLFVYSVFIVIAFGFFFHLTQKNHDALFENIRIILFMHPVFNLCLCISIVREVLIIRSVRLEKSHPVEINPMDGHMFTMHLSILLGACLWALTSGKFSYSLSLGQFSEYALVIPFLLIKFIVDVYTINKSAVKTIVLGENT